jgi:membrane fusion protein, adhesin transport system
MFSLTAKPVSKDVAYMRDMHQALINEKQGVMGLTLLLMLGAVAAALLWATNSRVEEITAGNGRVVPSSHEQVIQSLEAGILTELLVKEGDVVQAGQPLLKIDPTKANAVFQEGSNKVPPPPACALRHAQRPWYSPKTCRRMPSCCVTRSTPIRPSATR